MKNNKLIKVVLIASLLGSNAVMAESDYPATDFQPKVLYSDSDYKHSSDAPASASDKSVSKSAAVESSDSNYPATSYQPKVLYTDDSYKHTSEAPSAGSRSVKSTASSSSAASAAVEVVQTEKAASSNFSYIGLIALAIAGFFIYNKKAGVGKSQSSSADSYAAAVVNLGDVEGSTGVEKYLNKLADVNKTGVAKYLEKQTSVPSTGVAKYMAKQIVKDREVAASRATGVEKYLRDKG